MKVRGIIAIVGVGGVVALSLLAGLASRRTHDAATIAAPPPTLSGSGEPITEPPDGAAVGDADDIPPKSPVGAAIFYAERLRLCYPPKRLTRHEYQYGTKNAAFGHDIPTAWLELELTDGGELRGAKLSGAAGPLRACMAADVARLPIGTGSEKTTTVRVPLRGFADERLPRGDVQLFTTGDYYEEELDPSRVPDEWVALCRHGSGYALVPTWLSTNEREVRGEHVDVEGTFTKYESRECPGDEVPLLRGPAVDRWLRRRPAADAAIADAATDANADTTTNLATIPVASGELDAQGVTLALGDHAVRLRAKSDGRGGQALVAESGSVEEVLVEGSFSYEIEWAGDLDGDGRPDFLVSHAPDTPQLDLFLSSKATGGAAVRYAAGMGRMGD